MLPIGAAFCVGWRRNRLNALARSVDDGRVIARRLYRARLMESARRRYPVRRRPLDGNSGVDSRHTSRSDIHEDHTAGPTCVDGARCAGC